jgi:serine/threonine protein kinase/tetratricopeptide (TPR) repeat protein
MTSPMSDQPSAAELEKLFLHALDVPTDKRQAWLEERCAGKPALLAGVRELLRLDAQNADGLLEGVSAGNFAEQAPARIGSYRVTRLLAHGGMSAVFDAVHDKTGARAAVKLIRAGMATSRQLMRFQFESELLARLNHPSIAHLFDAGQARAEYADGTSALRSFIAMEYVQGQSIAKHCLERGLSMRQRVELMLEVARGVQHAHERGVVHRDLKPANILITEPTEGQPIGTPKVVDFGIAKLMSPGRSATVTGVIMGTLNYMSPEQMGGRSSEVGPASDVYAMGAILYELLAGKPPIEAPSTLSPSAAFAMLSAEPTRVISMRADVPLDLDAIVHKAIDRKIERRYANAREFGDDLERWLNSRPVEARQPTVIDRARLMYRRHPRLTVGVAVGCVSVLTLGSLATWQAVRASRAEQVAIARLEQVTKEKERADEQARVAEAVRVFVSKDILALANSSAQAEAGIKSSPDIKLVEVLDRASARVGDGRFKDQPAIEAAIRSTIGNAYIGLGRSSKAIEHLKRAAELNNEVLGPRVRPTLDCRAAWATALGFTGKDKEAIKAFEPLLDDSRQVLGNSDSLTLTIANNLAAAYLDVGRKDDALKLAKEAHALAVQSLGATRAETVRLAYILSRAEEAVGNTPSEEKLKAAIERAEKVLGPEHPDTLIARLSLGIFYKREGDKRRALETIEPLVPIAIERLGREHPKTLLFVNDLATLYEEIGDKKKAVDMFEEVYAIQLLTLGATDQRTLSTLHNVAATRFGLGQQERGAALMRESYDAWMKKAGPNSEDTLLSGSNLAEMYRRMGKLDEALTFGSDVVDRMNASLGPKNRYTLSATSMKSSVLIDLKRYEEAEPILRDGLARTIEAQGAKAPLANKYRRELARCLDGLGRGEEAESFRKQMTSK